MANKSCKELIENDDWIREKGEEEEKSKKQRESKRRRIEKHELLRIPTGYGKWKGGCFREVAFQYQKYKYSFDCKRMVRTYCSCDKALILCHECYAVHKAKLY